MKRAAAWIGAFIVLSLIADLAMGKSGLTLVLIGFVAVGAWRVYRAITRTAALTSGHRDEAQWGANHAPHQQLSSPDPYTAPPTAPTTNPWG